MGAPRTEAILDLMDEEEKKWIRETARREGVSAQTIYDAISITQDNIGDGYILEFIWERGASQLVDWYKRGIEDGKHLTTAST